ncbi:glutamate cyclase domain-containing protein [Oceanicaulis sp.]|uniref:glutamate cyclase domain-containing protein n=1 Tax=Oceanicaulis sp. TaxID=1924941 RepID=UPI003F71F087
MPTAPAPTLETHATDALFAALETELALGASRGADLLAPHAKGGLERAARHLTQTDGAIALFTGFYVAHAAQPAAETDGPLAVMAIAEALHALGRDVVVVTDTPCAPVLDPLIREAGLPGSTLLALDHADSLQDELNARGVRTVFSIERPGRAIDGRCYSMRGRDLSAHTLAFDAAFHPRSGFMRLAAGDGGNEIGMGALPKSALFTHVDQGQTIASATGADALIIAGVTHWTSYALAAAMAQLAPDQAPVWRDAVSDVREHHRLAAALKAGAVDGVTGQATPTIDGFALSTHLAKRDALFAVPRPA